MFFTLFPRILNEQIKCFNERNGLEIEAFIFFFYHLKRRYLQISRGFFFTIQTTVPICPVSNSLHALIKTKIRDFHRNKKKMSFSIAIVSIEIGANETFISFSGGGGSTRKRRFSKKEKKPLGLFDLHILLRILFLSRTTNDIILNEYIYFLIRYSAENRTFLHFLAVVRRV